MDFITEIENKLGRKAEKNLMPMQQGDVPATFAEVEDLVKNLDYKPSTSIKTGISNFIDWYIDYFKVKV